MFGSTIDSMDEKIMLTEFEVQTRFGIGVVQLRRMRARAIGPRFIKISGMMGVRGGRVVYPVKDLEAWLAQLPSGGSPGITPDSERAREA
jgi:hypothetical protein